MIERIPELPAYAVRVVDALEAAGFEAWVVGGWVRDALLGSASHDVDVCSSARWQDAARVLRAAGLAVHETGTQHGTVTAISCGKPVEVTTYRVDGSYSDARHPDSVTFVSDVREDLARRDFTINAMAYHPERGLLDPYGGERDLAAGLVRAVGDARARFDEDALRVLRAVRFAARYGFAVEEGTHEALSEYAPCLSLIANERIGQEVRGIFATGRMAWALETERDAMVAAIPELAPLVGFEQNSRWHIFDAYAHTAAVVAGMECVTAGMASEAMRWAALLHDVAKPACYSEYESGHGHFFGHP
ncbi:MAG: CCA tRNA nucleotidyltransferase, partial [Atopobiaceae bacterium]|nr:CCA tRNA nucleotidyltransferase [Atopobiaceae bacterium]